MLRRSLSPGVLLGDNQEEVMPGRLVGEGRPSSYRAGRCPMFARVAVYEIPGHRVEEAVGSFRQAIDQISGMDGLEEVYVLVSPESDRALTMSLWNQENAMEASRVTASRLRNDAAKVVDGSVQSVVEYEIAIYERIGP
jgi:heme-degrading monooxygenase HmoA